MRGKKETTAPIPPAAIGGEQSSMHKCSLSIAEKNADYKFPAGRKHGVGKDASVTLASIGVVTPQLSVSEFLRKLALGYVPKAMPSFEYQQLNQTLMTLYAAFKENSSQENAEVIVQLVRGLEDEFLNVEQRGYGAIDMKF